MSASPAVKTVRYAYQSAAQVKVLLISRQLTLPAGLEVITRLGGAEKSMERTGSLYPITV